MLLSNDIFSSDWLDDEGKMNCISRTDDEDKNLFTEELRRKRRWNLYSQIAIENDTLKCANKIYRLIDICKGDSVSQPCTLRDTNEVVDIGYDYNM